VKKSFNIQELLQCKSKLQEPSPMHPSLSKAFQRHQGHDFKHPSLVDLITTKQNKQTTLLRFIDRWQGQSVTHLKEKKPKAWQKREIGLMLHNYGCFGHKIYTYGAFTLDVKSSVK
jgi:hypothetical protein